MEKIILKRYELKKDVLALDTKNMATRLKKGDKYWFDLNNNAGKKKVLLYKKTKKTDGKTRYLDCIRIDKCDLNKYFKELKDEMIEVSKEDEQSLIDDDVQAMLNEIENKIESE